MRGVPVPDFRAYLLTSLLLLQLSVADLENGIWDAPTILMSSQSVAAARLVSLAASSDLVEPNSQSYAVKYNNVL